MNGNAATTPDATTEENLESIIGEVLGIGDETVETESEQSIEAPAQPEAASDGDSNGDEDAQEPTEAEKVQAMLDAAGGEAMRLDPESVPEPLRPFLRSFQADYTRKRQADAEKAKAAQSEVETLRTQIEELRQHLGTFQMAGAIQPQQFQPQQFQPQQPDFEAMLSAGLGELISFEEAMESTDPNMLKIYYDQRAIIEGRRAAAEMAAQLAPAIKQTMAISEQDAIESANKQRESVFTENPELLPYEDAMAAVLTNTDKTLTEVVEMFKAVANKDKEVQAAIAVGMQAGKEQAEQVAKNKQQFSVPSVGGQKQAATPPQFKEGSSPQEIGEQLADQMGW